MPFIDSKVTVALTPDKQESIKSKLGQAISTMGKSENYLMVGFEDEYELYMGGQKLEKGAFVSVRVLGQVNADASDRMTAEICKIYQEELDIPGQNVYVAYFGTPDWGWNGSNF
ncbi:MAG: phenylpyruvate tautomerase MIF-related protein [Eubacteriales bacterium]|nr:phenylpyruvate tautomerase MIF-related protein [Eubacteriales bacterium]